MFTVSEMDELYREVILDHYKNPRGYGVDRGRRRPGGGHEPALRRRGLDLRLVREDGDTIEDVKFRGRGCAISQAATSMLTEMVKGRKAPDVAALNREELLEEVGHPAHADAAQVRAARARRSQGRAAPRQGHASARGVGRASTSSSSTSMAELDVCPVEELPPGEVKIVRAGELAIGVYNADGELYAIEDRCSHDDGPLAEGDWDPEEHVAICPRHGSRVRHRGRARRSRCPRTSRWRPSR